MSPSHSDGERLMRYLDAGFIAGLVLGAGISGLFWMSPYISFSLWFIGTVLAMTAWTAAREHR